MLYLHDEVHICHRDLKFDNILLGTNYADPITEDDKQPTIKICDFTLATFLDREKSDQVMLVEQGGTLPFNAPEMF